MMSKWAHATVIAVDVTADKLAACTKIGADAVVDASAGMVVEQILDLTKGAGVDVAIDYVSSTQTQEQAIDCLGIGGRFVTLGGPVAPFRVPGQQVLAKELEILGSRYCSRQHVVEALELCARGEVWPLVTETHPLADAETLHQRLDDGAVVGRGALLIGT
jgi:D-arabinose 1-dehydrogenase-like Zn-dependent alcohol dehydrogenase